MPQRTYNLETVARMLEEHGEKAAKEERERILGLLDNEIDEWKIVSEKSVDEQRALRMLRTRITRIDK
jgi:hypothetical protein